MFIKGLNGKFNQIPSHDQWSRELIKSVQLPFKLPFRCIEISFLTNRFIEILSNWIMSSPLIIPSGLYSTSPFFSIQINVPTINQMESGARTSQRFTIEVEVLVDTQSLPQTTNDRLPFNNGPSPTTVLTPPLTQIHPATQFAQFTSDNNSRSCNRK